jgi:hypothetical protein
LNWQAVDTGNIQATFDVRLASAITVRRFTLATSRSGRQCLNLPSWRATDPSTGERSFDDVIGFDDEAARNRFKSDLLAAVDTQIGGAR